MNPLLLLADALVLLHWLVVLFVVLSPFAFACGALLDRRGTPARSKLARYLVRAKRSPRWRIAHLLTLAWIVVNTWLGKLCFLTIWEFALRDAAGQIVTEQGFIARWLAQALYIEAPWWAFVAAYSVFFALVLLTLWWAPPDWRARPRR